MPIRHRTVTHTATSGFVQPSKNPHFLRLLNTVTKIKDPKKTVTIAIAGLVRYGIRELIFTISNKDSS